MRQVTRQFNDILSWADMYSASPIDVKKMIVAQLISAVRVSDGYKIEIDFKISKRQLGLENEQETAHESLTHEPKRSKKHRDEPEL